MMYTLLILFVALPFAHSDCNYTSRWFNENHPWDSHTNGNDIERFGLIRAKYPWTFELTPWTGSFEIRHALHQHFTDATTSLATYTTIKDGLICHAVDGKQCVDHEIRFCLQANSCGIPGDSPDQTHLARSGSEVRPHSLPWHVSIQYDRQHICSGTLIDARHVLTTARCFEHSLVPLAYSVVVGAHHLSNATQRVPIDRLMFHQDYNRVTSANDIGIIRLSAPLPSFSHRVTPICSPRSSKQPPKSKMFVVAGWRTINNDTWSVSETDELRQAILTANDECSNVYTTYNAKKQLCAGTEQSWRDLCQGDIGSGLFQKQTYDVDRWILVGMTSYGCEHASQGYPGVYVKISAYYDWIQKEIEQMHKEK